MALSKIYTCIIEFLVGCYHDDYEISSVEFGDGELSGFDVKRYLVDAKCNKCGRDCSHIINAMYIDDPRVTNAAKWLSSHGLTWFE